MENKTVVLNAYTIGGKKFAYVPTSEMRLDRSYQRVVCGNVNKIAKEWDINCCDMLLVSYRDDAFYVVDGQHRMLAARQNNVDFLPCEIREGLTRKDEAALFARQNVNVKKLTPYDIFKANMVIEDPIDIRIFEACDKRGIKVGKTGVSTDVCMTALTTARKIVETEGVGAFEWMLDVIHDSDWHYARKAYGECIIRALFGFYRNHDGQVNDFTNNIVAAFKEITPQDFMAKASIEFSNLGRVRAMSTYMEVVASGNAAAETALVAA